MVSKKHYKIMYVKTDKILRLEVWEKKALGVHCP